MFCAAIVTCIYSPVMTMFTHREKRQKHKDKTASSATHELPNRQTGRQTDKLSGDERAGLSFCNEENTYETDLTD